MLFEGKSQCSSNARTVVCAENHNQHILHNPDLLNIYQYRVDGDIIRNTNGEKCDYIVEVETADKPTAYVIELKGSDLEKAISQIETTINRFDLTKSHNVLPRVVIHRVNVHQVKGSVYRSHKKKYPYTMVKERLLEERVG